MPEVRLIDANAFSKQYGNYYAEEGPEEGFIGTVGDLIKKQPTIEAKPVRHGRWETINPLYSNVYCSECGAAADKYLAKRYKGCPFCLCVMSATDTNGGGKGGADNG